jgi:TolA-binding protein
VITHPPWLERLIPQLAAPNAAPKPKPAHRGNKPAPAVVVEHAQPPRLVPEPVVVERPARPTPREASVRSAAEIFAAANEARRERTTREAVRLYRELERQHPRSEETKVARIALGRLLLDRAGDPRGALKQFEAYLEDREQHSLREEAMVGRALALGRLGRAREERAAWQALLQAFPASANAERARARVDELR